MPGVGIEELDRPRRLAKIVVAGGCGFVGSAFVRAVLGALPETRIVVLDPLENPRRMLRLGGLVPDDRLEVLRSAASNRRTVVRACREADALVSVEGWGPGRPNCAERPVTTEALLRAAAEAGVPCFLHLSSAEVYGIPSQGIRVTESSPLQPPNPASASLAAADQLVMSYALTRGHPAMVVRASRVHGPFDEPDAFVPTLVARALQRKSITLHGTGMDREDWLHVDDLCGALLAVLRRGRLGAAYNVGSGEPMPRLVLAHLVLSLAGARQDLISFLPERRRQARKRTLSTRRITEELRWTPQVSHLEGLKRTVEWLLDHPRWPATLLGTQLSPLNVDPGSPADPPVSGWSSLARTLLSPG